MASLKIYLRHNSMHIIPAKFFYAFTTINETLVALAINRIHKISNKRVLKEISREKPLMKSMRL